MSRSPQGKARRRLMLAQRKEAACAAQAETPDAKAEATPAPQPKLEPQPKPVPAQSPGRRDVRTRMLEILWATVDRYERELTADKERLTITATQAIRCLERIDQIEQEEAARQERAAAAEESRRQLQKLKRPLAWPPAPSDAREDDFLRHITKQAAGLDRIAAPIAGEPPEPALTGFRAAAPGTG